MYRIVLFLVLIALAVAGGVWVADQTGDVVLLAGGAKVTITAGFAQALGIALVAALLAWLILGGIGRVPERSAAAAMKSVRRAAATPSRKDCSRSGMAMRPRHACHAETARKNAGHDPLALLLHAQSAQLSGDREGARTRVPCDGRARRYATARPARIVHRSAARR